jgi:hypothetical protein
MLVLTVTPKNVFAAGTTAPLLSSPANYSAPTGGPGTVKIPILNLVGTGATDWQYILGTDPFTPPDLDSNLGGASYTADTDIPVAPGQDHLLLLATDGGGLIKSYADIDISGLLSSPTNYSAPIKGQAANTTKITFLSPVGISGATNWQYILGTGSMAQPNLGNTVAGANNYVVNTDIPVTTGQDHLLLLATGDDGRVKAYAYIDITGSISSAAATLNGGGIDYSDPIPGSAIGTTKIANLDLTGVSGTPTKWQYKVQTDPYVPALDSTLPGAINYTQGNNIPISANQHLILLATDGSGKIKAYADITVQDTPPGTQIEPAAAALVSGGTNYSTPISGLTPGTTRIVTLDSSGIPGAAKWQYKVQAGAFAVPPLNSTLTGASDYTVNTDIAITAGQHLMLMATTAGGNILAYVDLTITSGQINSNNMLLSTPGNYSTPVPGGTSGSTQIASLNLSGILGATQWQYKLQAGSFAIPAYNSLAGAANGFTPGYTAGTDILVTSGQHLLLVATDATGSDKIKAYADITILSAYIRPANLDVIVVAGDGKNYSTPEPGGAGGNTKIATLNLTGITGATKWQYKVQTGPFSVPGLDTTLVGAADYTAGADIPITAGQHLMLLATDADGMIKGFVDLTVGSIEINTTSAAGVLLTPANFSVPEAGSTSGSTKIAGLNLTGIAGAKNWRYALQTNPFTTPALDDDSDTLSAAAHDYTAGTDIAVTPGQHLLLLATNDTKQIKAYVDLTLLSGQIRANALTTPANYFTPVPGSAGGTTKIATLNLITGTDKWQYAVQAGAFAIPVLDSTLAGARDYTAGSDIAVATGQHLVLLETDSTGKIKASADITVAAGSIRAYDLSSPANYSAPVPGTAAGTIRIATLNMSGITAATKWQYAVQAGALLAPALDSTLPGAGAYTAGSNITVSAGQHLILLATDDNGKIKAYADLTVAQNQIKNAATLSTNFTTESEVAAGNKTITIDLTLSGCTWASDVPTIQSKKNLLFDNLKAGGSEAAEWAKVVANLKTAVNPVSLVGNVLTITLPATSGYNITADQQITVAVPPSLLQTSGTVTLVPSTFIIKTDSAVNITGTITSSATAADVRKGGKTIVVTLVNLPAADTWAADIALDTTKRQALFSALSASGAEAAKWNTDVINALEASATIVRTSPTVVTITLPPVPTYNVTAPQTIQLSSIPAACLTSGNSFSLSSPSAFTITPAGSTAAVTGTITGTSASPTSEATIVAGGNTIIYTLTNDTWVYDIATNSAKYNLLFDNLALTSGGSGEASQWANVITALKSAGTIVRTSDTVVTITLPAVPTYHITAAQTITPAIPSSLVGGGVSPVLSSTCTIYPVSAAVSGTVVSAATVQDNIVSGGKTIIITLSKGTWAADVVSNSVKVNQLIEGIRLSAGDSTDTPDTQWQKVRTALKASTGKIKVNGPVLTITLPPVPDYFIQADQTVTVALNKNLLKLPTAVDLQAAPSFKIYSDTLQSATATLSFNQDLSVTDIRGGTALVTITLNNDTWVGDIVSNKNNLVKLIGAFTAATDTDQWELVKTALKNNMSVITMSSDNIISIAIPAVSNYNIAMDQVVTLKIPKALLNLTKADLTATPSLTIKAGVKGTLGSMLQDGSLDTLLEDHSPSNIYVTVPKKYINEIDMSNSALGSSNFTSLNVNAEEEVNAIQFTVGGVVRTSLNYSVVKGKRVFNIGFSGLENDSDITIAAYSDTGCTTVLGKDVTVKVASGNTTPYPPKGASSKSLAGAYSLQELISDSKLFSSILLQYTLDELTVTTLS